MSGLSAIDASLLTLAAIFLAMVLTLGATLAWGVFQTRADRLPAATRFADIRERLALKQAEHSELQARIHELDQKMHDRDRLVAEVEALQRRIDEIRLEYENLKPAVEEIARVKEEAAEAAQLKAEAEQKLSDLREETERLRAEIDPERVARLKREKLEAEGEFDRIRSELERLRPELDAALRGIAEARAAEARLEAQRIENERLQAELDRLSAERDPLAGQVSALQDELAAARRARDEADMDRETAERKRAKVETEIATLETLRDRLAGQVGGLGAAGGNAGEPTEEERRAILADLVALPACLEIPAVLRAESRPETDALHEVAKYLKDCGLSFGRRTLHAFHTALKINDAAQLTVLAGVSGTGKSLLPRRYAEAMGIHFLQVAVEPRWDSPQDLLGFYNYVEGKYRATELARLLAHLDPWRSLDLPEGAHDRRNHMALVLLDEMNLARVEYYFSEFLSRLEVRPAWREGLSPEACKDALIPVDIRGLDQPPRLFPAHNVLFVGTMNDDESTQSLSDKVLDRGNVMQFPAPAGFPPPVQGAGTPSGRAQVFREWRSWVRPANALQGAADSLARDTISARMLQTIRLKVLPGRTRACRLPIRSSCACFQNCAELRSIRTPQSSRSSRRWFETVLMIARSRRRSKRHVRNKCARRASSSGVV